MYTSYSFSFFRNMTAVILLSMLILSYFAASCQQREPLRIFYESLSKQIPTSEMAEFWLVFLLILQYSLCNI